MMFSLQGFDENSNGVLDGQEIVKFKKEPTIDRKSAWSDHQSAWIDSKMVGDNNTVTKDQLAQFFLTSLAQ